MRLSVYVSRDSHAGRNRSAGRVPGFLESGQAPLARLRAGAYVRAGVPDRREHKGCQRFVLRRDQVRPDLWAALFSDKTLVKAFQYRDLSTRFIHSYPVRTVVDYVKGSTRQWPDHRRSSPALAYEG